MSVLILTAASSATLKKTARALAPRANMNIVTTADLARFASNGFERRTI